jgi:undecaprenyl-diphosphatase
MTAKSRSRSIGWLGALPVLVLIAALGATAYIAAELRGGVTFGFDTAVLLALRTPGDLARPIGPVWLTQAFIDNTGLGGGTLRWLFGVAAIGFLIDIRRRIEAGWLAASLVGASVLNVLLKAVLHRPRPEIVPHLTASTGASFPSGHAMVAAAVYLTIGLMLAETQKRRAVRVYLMLFFITLVLLIGSSRVYLGVHWPSDVLAGWTIGAAWALAMFAAKRSFAGWGSGRHAGKTAGPGF